MPPKNNASSSFSISMLLRAFVILSILSLTLFFFTSLNHSDSFVSSLSQMNAHQSTAGFINVYVTDLPRSLNYGLLDKYWAFDADSRLGSDADRDIRSNNLAQGRKFPPYPENPLIKQYSAEYWITGDLMTPREQRTRSFARRVFDVKEADVIFVPFFATLSAEMQLGMAKGQFRKKVGNEDYQRQKEVIEFLKNTEAWKRSGGRDHVFVLTGVFHFTCLLA
ncbi:hypothetical protein QN277_010854 [Acacia crassicarpa]|uniref:Exostosin GT47 domain-containing protein n=1 Tax=Acacia crassicarpa TaxID=499986 RepID=A0AAE1MAZ6_9FABA|nr:hypothetical protein QN277_010854 [Acacia crassicarpa]